MFKPAQTSGQTSIFLKKWKIEREKNPTHF